MTDTSKKYWLIHGAKGDWLAKYDSGLLYRYEKSLGWIEDQERVGRIFLGSYDFDIITEEEMMLIIRKMEEL